MAKKTIDHEERLKLCEKLDKDLDEFIQTREKAPYTEGWDESNWENEMKQHPFFMKQIPEEGEELPPLLEAFQQLKYDPEENTADELAQTYKEEGNFNFKMKKYRFAISNYTEGVKLNCSDVDLKASLFLNRAAAHFHLQNFRSSLNDSLQAAKLKPDYMKAIVRAAQCCLELKRFTDGLKWCDYGLRLKGVDEKLVDIRTKLETGLKTAERNRRKEELIEKKEMAKEAALLKAIESRGITIVNIKGQRSRLDLSILEPCHPAANGKKVHFENDSLVWPVMFLYPEFGETDFIQEFHEDSSFVDHVDLVFQERPLWDIEKKYSANNLRIYYEDTDQHLHPFDPQSTLRDILSQKTYQVKAGTPGFIFLVEGSEFQKEFLKRYEKR